MIGVLALQGDFREHIAMLKRLGADAKEVRTIEDFKQVNALIIPGGESTTIGKLLKETGLGKAVKQRDIPIYGSCAGAILLAKNIEDSRQLKLNKIDISISRNSYGRQIDSFEDEIEIKGMKKKFPAVFIRAPKIIATGKDVEILATHNSFPILARQGNILISTFHPEMTDDARIHKYFLEMVN